MLASAALAAQASTGSAALPYSRGQSARRQPAACFAVQPTLGQPGTYRRTLAQHTISLGGSTIMKGLRTSAVGSRLPQNQLLGCAAARQLQRGADTISKHGMQKALTVAASPPLSIPAAGSGVSSSRSCAAAAQHMAAAAPPRVLELQSPAELRHLLACHKGRLLVVHLVTADCPIGQARSC